MVPEIASVGGKIVDEMTREELIAAVKMLGKALEAAHSTYQAAREIASEDRLRRARGLVKQGNDFARRWNEYPASQAPA